MPFASPSEIATAAAQLRGADPATVVNWAVERFGSNVAVSSSFSVEDCVLIDLLHKATKGHARVFALDTGRLHDETYLTAERVRMKYGVEIAWTFPQRDAVEALLRTKGLYSFRDSLDERHECCGIRKVEPLGRALAGLDAWITGLRREQSVTRTDGAEVEVDAAHGGMTKVNPLIGWTMEQVRAYAKANAVPVHPLHDKGFPSIGCAPCTRAIQPGEHPRAGRWWWEDPENKECGLHLPVAS
ncbi:MAG TPA: phosphoadenylyl-sulfate reductase [Polyangia bacterium]|nr:phosphoadenylyl-sulfate reductase [Polyangia bacterium]